MRRDDGDAMRGMIRHPLLAAAGLIALVAWAPMPFGSVTPGFAALLEAAAFAVLAVAALMPAPSRRAALGGPDAAPAWPRGALEVALALAAVAALGLAQSVAWPAGWVAAISPAHARYAAESAALAGAAAPAAVAPSLAPGASRAAAFAWLLPAAGLLAAARLGASRRVRRALAATLLATALFEVLFGARAWFARSTEIWGVETPLAALRLRGTFVNPNHLALALEIALAVAFAWLWWSARRAAAEAGAERRLLRVAPPALVWTVLFAGLAFTGSRSGMLAALAGTGAALALAARGRSRRWALAAGLAALALGAGLAVSAGVEAGFGRLLGTSAGDASLHSRLAAAGRTLELWRRFPLFGSGLGSFLAAFPLVQSPPSGMGEAIPGIWRHAHDDWVELLATAGLLGAVLVALGLAATVRALARSWRAAERGEERAAVLAAVGALVAVAIHALTDFGLTLPANAFTLAVVVGAAIGAGHKKSPGDRPAPR